MSKAAAFKVWRSDDAGGHYESYSVDVVPGMVAHRVGTLTLVCPTRPMPWAAYPPASCRVVIATPIR